MDLINELTLEIKCGYVEMWISMPTSEREKDKEREMEREREKDKDVERTA
jgi:hypothetical protein